MTGIETEDHAREIREEIQREEFERRAAQCQFEDAVSVEYRAQAAAHAARDVEVRAQARVRAITRRIDALRQQLADLIPPQRR